MNKAARKRIWGWFFFDWASQPYNTLLLTFIFGPYVKELLNDGSAAQTIWGYGISAAGILTALLAPLLGGIADRAGPRTRLNFIWLFSIAYVIGASGVWLAAPGDFNVVLVLALFGLGLLGMEFATIFTNAMLPDLAPRDQIGRLSGSGWAFGYAGGLAALALVLMFFAENSETGTTLIGTQPAFGLDPAHREGTRAVGPLTALWYVVFMIPFFLWVREARPSHTIRLADAARTAWPDLKASLAHLPSRPSLFAFLGASMFYRDALNGLYFFGGIYAAGVLDWSVVDVGTFGILAVLSGAFFAWLGGRADTRFGPKPVIVLSVLILATVTLAVVFVTRDRLFGLALPEDSKMPDIAFYILGMTIGAAGGTLQAASRSMMVRQGDREQMTQGFGLYALAGKATSFLAPFLVAVATDLSGSQQMGITPLLALFLIGLVLLLWVKPDGDDAT
ncbi:MFS transporter [Qingshengfaniella alkalisoli]|uniref:MFS transporter n=1 Tax=Qingshengfaniella alkalisoli TaxID=2599296 RepID=A0A5B8IWG3_9RHOB|nr:MFS transporter [Qingshengfaniella alkalisoli]QDY70004.1 MFS transporter [Qingshengfaniella alkalisoli]